MSVLETIISLIPIPWSNIDIKPLDSDGDFNRYSFASRIYATRRGYSSSSITSPLIISRAYVVNKNKLGGSPPMRRKFMSHRWINRVMFSEGAPEFRSIFLTTIF